MPGNGEMMSFVLSEDWIITNDPVFEREISESDSFDNIDNIVNIVKIINIITFKF